MLKKCCNSGSNFYRQEEDKNLNNDYVYRISCGEHAYWIFYINMSETEMLSDYIVE